MFQKGDINSHYLLCIATQNIVFLIAFKKNTLKGLVQLPQNLISILMECHKSIL